MQGSYQKFCWATKNNTQVHFFFQHNLNLHPESKFQAVINDNTLQLCRHKSMELDDDTQEDAIKGGTKSVHDLSKALLQVKQMVEPRYMNPPLGEDEKTREKQQRETLELAFQGPTPRKIRAKVWDKKPKEKKKRAEDDDGKIASFR